MAFLRLIDVGRQLFTGARQRTGMFALKHLKNGQVIQSKWPIVCSATVWNEHATYPNPLCEYCLKGLDTPVQYVRRFTERENYISFLERKEGNGNRVSVCMQHVPCREGCEVFYCNKECQSMAWESYHKRLCHERDSRKLDQLRAIATMWRGDENNYKSFDVFILLKWLAMDHQNQFYELFNLVKQKSTEESVGETHAFIHHKFGDKFDEFTTLIKNFGQAQKFVCNPKLMTSDGIFTLIHTVLASKIEVMTCWENTWRDQYKNNFHSSMQDLYQKMGFQGIEEMVKSLEKNRITNSKFDHAGYAIYSSNFLLKRDQEHGNCEVAFPQGNSRVSLTALRDIRMGEELILKTHRDAYIPCENRSTQVVAPANTPSVQQTHTHQNQDAMDNSEMMEVEEAEGNFNFDFSDFFEDNNPLIRNRRRSVLVSPDHRNTGDVPANADHEPPPSSRRRLETFSHLAQHIHTKKGMDMAVYEVITSDFELTPNIGPEVGALRQHFANRLEIPVESVSSVWFGISLHSLYKIKSVQKREYDANRNKMRRSYYLGLQAKQNVPVDCLYLRSKTTKKIIIVPQK